MAVAKKSEKVTNFGNFIIIIWYFSKGLLCSTTACAMAQRHNGQSKSVSMNADHDHDNMDIRPT